MLNTIILDADINIDKTSKTKFTEDISFLTFVIKNYRKTSMQHKSAVCNVPIIYYCSPFSRGGTKSFLSKS